LYAIYYQIRIRKVDVSKMQKKDRPVHRFIAGVINICSFFRDATGHPDQLISC